MHLFHHRKLASTQPPNPWAFQPRVVSAEKKRLRKRDGEKAVETAVEDHAEKELVDVVQRGYVQLDQIWESIVLGRRRRKDLAPNLTKLVEPPCLKQYQEIVQKDLSR